MDSRVSRGPKGLEHALITDELARRPRRPPDYEAENQALTALARDLAAQPQAILQKLADTALVLTRAGSAGISILEDDRGDTVFRWRSIAGIMAQRAGGTMPLDDSPCGLVVARNATLLFADLTHQVPELADVRPEVVEALLVPFHAGDRPLGTVWALSHDPECRFDSEDARLLESLSRFAGAAWQLNVALAAAAETRTTLERSVAERTRALSDAQAQLAAEMAELNRLHDMASRALFQRDVGAALHEILDAAIELQGADMGDVQILNAANSQLQIAAQRGLDDTFIETLRRVNMHPMSAARRALRTAERVMLDFEPADGQAARAPGALAGLQAVVATPLTTRGGARLGVLTTYFQRSHLPSTRELRVLDLYARHAGDAIERLQAEETLHASEEKFRLLVQAVQDHGIIMLDESGNVASWNEGAERILGYSAGEVMGTSAARFMTPVDLQNGLFERELNTAASTGRSGDENWMVRKDGSRFWASGTSTALRRASGELTGFAKIFRDLTERKVTEDALREKDLRLRAALAAGRMGTWHWDVQSDRKTLDDSLQRLLGLPAPGAVGSLADFLALIHADDRTRVADAFARSVSEGESLDVEFRVVWPDGSTHWLQDQGDVFHAPDWSPQFLTGACVDITDRKKAEAALAASERRQRLLAASATRLLAEPNPEVLLRQTLAEAAELIGLDSWFGHLASEDGLQLMLSSCGGIEDALCNDLNAIQVMPSDPADGPDLRPWIAGIEDRFIGLAHRAGLRSVACRALQARGKLIGMICIGSHTARQFAAGEMELLNAVADQLAAALARQRAEAALVDADNRKDEFLAMLSHELRNPLAPLASALEIVRRQPLDDATRQRMHAMINRQLGHLTRLVDDLLDVSRITRGKIELRREPIDLAAVIDQALEMVAGAIEHRRHQLAVDLPAAPLMVEGDATRLTQVVFNLLSNSAKYTEAGGRIELSARRDDGHVVLRVSDNGIGMPPDLVPRVFDLFTQGERLPDRAQGGLGLGLTLVRRLVEMHGGSVHATSGGVGRGSDFIVRLPLAAPGAQPARPAGSAPREAAARIERVLIVDDNVDAAEATMLLLRGLVREIAVAHSGAHAIELARELQPQVVLLDLGLPRMDGYEVARRLRAEPGLGNLVIAAVTGYGQASDRERTRSAGFDEHLVKPVGHGELEKLLAEAAQRILYTP